MNKSLINIPCTAVYICPLVGIPRITSNVHYIVCYPYYLFTVMSYNKPHTRIFPSHPTETELKIDIIRIHIPILSFRRYFGFSVTLVHFRYGIPDFYPPLRFIVGTGYRYYIYKPVTFGISDRKIRILQKIYRKSGPVFF